MKLITHTQDKQRIAKRTIAVGIVAALMLVAGTVYVLAQAAALWESQETIEFIPATPEPTSAPAAAPAPPAFEVTNVDRSGATVNAGETASVVAHYEADFEPGCYFEAPERLEVWCDVDTGAQTVTWLMASDDTFSGTEEMYIAITEG